MADTALDIIETRAIGQIRAASPDFQIFTDRSDEEPLQADELPGVVARIVNCSWAPMPGEEMVQWIATATFQFDCQSGRAAGQTIDSINRATAAFIIGALFADPTLNGRAVDMFAPDLSGAEQDGADIGTAILQLDIQFITRRGDLTKVIGMGGQTFTD